MKFFICIALSVCLLTLTACAPKQTQSEITEAQPQVAVSNSTTQPKEKDIVAVIPTATTASKEIIAVLNEKIGNITYDKVEVKSEELDKYGVYLMAEMPIKREKALGLIGSNDNLTLAHEDDKGYYSYFNEETKAMLSGSNSSLNYCSNTNDLFESYTSTNGYDKTITNDEKFKNKEISTFSSESAIKQLEKVLSPLMEMDVEYDFSGYDNKDMIEINEVFSKEYPDDLRYKNRLTKIKEDKETSYYKIKGAFSIDSIPVYEESVAYEGLRVDVNHSNRVLPPSIYAVVSNNGIEELYCDNNTQIVETLSQGNASDLITLEGVKGIAENIYTKLPHDVTMKEVGLKYLCMPREFTEENEEYILKPVWCFMAIHDIDVGGGHIFTEQLTVFIDAVTGKQIL